MHIAAFPFFQKYVYQSQKNTYPIHKQAKRRVYFHRGISKNATEPYGQTRNNEKLYMNPPVRWDEGVRCSVIKAI